MSLSVASKMVRHGSAGWHESLADFEWPRMFGGVFPVRGKRPALALSFAEQTLPLEDFCRSVIGINNKARGFLCLMSKSHHFDLFLGIPRGTERFTIVLALRCATDASIVVKSPANLTAAGVRPGGRQPWHMHMVKPSTPKAQTLALRCQQRSRINFSSDLDAAAEHGPDISFLAPRLRLSSHSRTPPRSNCSAAPFLEDDRVYWVSR